MPHLGWVRISPPGRRPWAGYMTGAIVDVQHTIHGTVGPLNEHWALVTDTGSLIPAFLVSPFLSVSLQLYSVYFAIFIFTLLSVVSRNCCFVWVKPVDSVVMRVCTLARYFTATVISDVFMLLRLTHLKSFIYTYHFSGPGGAVGLICLSVPAC